MPTWHQRRLHVMWKRTGKGERQQAHAQEAIRKGTRWARSAGSITLKQQAMVRWPGPRIPTKWTRIDGSQAAATFSIMARANTSNPAVLYRALPGLTGRVAGVT